MTAHRIAIPQEAFMATNTPAWEYMSRTIAYHDPWNSTENNVDKVLNELAAEGWEVIAVCPYTPQWFLFRRAVLRKDC